MSEVFVTIIQLSALLATQPSNSIHPLLHTRPTHCNNAHSLCTMEVEQHGGVPLSREEWRREMRKNFCKKDMIDDDGNLVKE